jgi:extracellular elastinolytic metalloproteinase
MCALGADMSVKVIFFDLGDTLGQAVLSPLPAHLLEFNVFPFVGDLLTRLRGEGLRLGIISNTGSDSGAQVDSVLARAGILDHFEPALRIYSQDIGLKKDSPQIFLAAAARAGEEHDSASCLFVGEDVVERAHAAAAGLQVCPHPLLIESIIKAVIADEARPAQARRAELVLRYVRISSDGAALPWRPLADVKAGFVPLQVMGRRRNVLYAIVAEDLLPLLASANLRADFLGAPGLPLSTDLFIQRDASSLMAAPQRDLVVGTAPEGLVIALPANRSLAEIHVEAMQHGHTLKLVPDPLLIGIPSRFPLGVAALGAEEPLTEHVAGALNAINSEAIQHRVDRYAGAANLQDGTPVLSRHLAHPDNHRAVEAMAAELAALGQGRIVVRLHRFSHRGRELFNVEGEIAGQSPELILVTAHLDSTAANSQPYDETTDKAPGADDDASGIAAVLTVAEVIAGLTGSASPQRTIRFVLFNAEEEGLVGSRVYARLQRVRQASIAGVFQMDMVGFNRERPRSWELHVGCRTAPDVEAASLPLAHALQRLTAEVSPELAAPQIYRSGPGIDDPADGRSDHSSFHSFGYPALCASEDFFAGPDPDSPAPEANPHYHQRDDDFIDPAYAADIARAIGATVWQLAGTTVMPQSASAFMFVTESSMPASREYDSRKSAPAAAARHSRPLTAAAPTRTNPITGTAFAQASAPAKEQSLVAKALSFVHSHTFAATDGGTQYIPDPSVQRTSSGAAAVNLHQFYHGIPVFQMTRTVRFDPHGSATEAMGNDAPLPPDLNTEPQLGPVAAVLAATKFLSSVGTGATLRSQYGDVYPAPTLDVSNYQPEIVTRFPGLPASPTVVSKGPLENDVPAYLVVFVQPGAPRLAWYMTLTFPDYTDQYTVIVAADGSEGEILYSRSKMHHAKARAHVFEFSPGISPRREIPLPRPINDFPVTPSAPLVMFPADWIDDTGRAVGNTTIATLGASSTTLPGVPQSDGTFMFHPANDSGDEQKMLNIFYFCNYMHDFLFMLGFDEAAGNFQKVNFANVGLGNDPVRARAHSGAVTGTANMSTGPDGQPPLMNMGLVVGSGRHTAFDFDVVAHEYTHGLTNRVVGGRMNANALEELQSGGMGEGWSDFFALTIQGFLHGREKKVVGDWVVNSARGIRRAPYDDQYPFHYGQLVDSPEVHDIGEIWCASLMKMTRLIRSTLGDDSSGYRLAWQLVVDALKVTPANPTLLDGRDAILRALDDFLTVRRIPADVHRRVRAAIWQAFAAFGMGVGASSVDADVQGIVADNNVPPDLIA